MWLHTQGFKCTSELRDALELHPNPHANGPTKDAAFFSVTSRREEDERRV